VQRFLRAAPHIAGIPAAPQSCGNPGSAAQSLPCCAASGERLLTRSARNLRKPIHVSTSAWTIVVFLPVKETWIWLVAIERLACAARPSRSKLNQIKLAARVVSARSDQPRRGLPSHPMPLPPACFGKFAGIFLIRRPAWSASRRLFRWIEINYGLFPGVRAVVGALAAGDRPRSVPRWLPISLKRQPPRFSVSQQPACASPSRPVRSSRIRSMPRGDSAKAILSAPSSPANEREQQTAEREQGADGRQ